MNLHNRSGRPVRALDVFLLAVFAAMFVWSAIHPAELGSWASEAVPALAIAAVLAFTYKRFRFTELTYTVVALGCVLMLIGGH